MILNKMMKMHNTIFLFSLIVGLVFSAPMDNSEVEFVEPVNTHGDDAETNFFDVGQSPIFVIHGRLPQNFPQFGIPGLSPSKGFPFSFENFFGIPRRSQNDGDDEEVEIDFLPPPISNGDKTDSNSKPFCGFFCKIFADLEKQLELIGQQKGSLFPTLDSDKTNTTYTEKVLPDGTVVRVNQTTFSDADGNGNAFFFHQSTHFVDGSDDEQTKKVDEEVSEDEEDKSPEGPSKPNVQIIPDEEIGFKLPEDFDPNLNEVSEGISSKRRSKRSAESDELPAYGQSSTEPLIPIGDRDIRVNKLILENGKRGGLVQIDPDSELIVEIDEGLVVPLDEVQSGQGIVSEWNQQAESRKSTWNNQQRSSIIHYPDH